MGSTWRYVSEARGHLIEIYEQLLGMPLNRPCRHLVGMHPPAELVEAEAKADNEWYECRVAKLLYIVDILNKYNVARAITDWQEHAIAFLGKTPSARNKQKFRDEEDRVLFLCVALWYAKAAVVWLDAREDEGLLQGGLSYREMTARAASLGSCLKCDVQSAVEILPEESAVIDDMEDDDPRLSLYQKWTYIPLDMDDF